jgi:multiple sugar transport system permease protein/putative chitobiose transport system permease protein
MSTVEETTRTLLLAESPAPRRGRKRASRTEGRRNPVLTAVAVVIGAAFVLPALWIFVSSFRPNADIVNSLSPVSWGMIIPSHLTLENYVNVLGPYGFAQALLNSLIVCLSSVVIGILISATAGYALAVYNFPGRNVVFAIVVISFMIPFEAIAIPLSQTFTNWGLGNTLVGLILPGIGNGLAVFNMRQHFLNIPASYREAAMLDGASEPRILFSIYVPMSTSALTNSALLIFLAQWTAYLWPLILISTPSLQVAPIALANTFGQHTSDYGANFAGATLLALIPAATMFVLQRFFGRISIGSGEK